MIGELGELMKADLLALTKEITAEFPTFNIVYKANSWFMKVINTLLWTMSFGKNTTFMSSFTTTIGCTSYVPSGWDGWTEEAKVSILRHERIHMRQTKTYGVVLFSFLYLFAWFPIGLAYWRSKFEKEAYTETLRAYRDFGYPLDDLRKQQIIEYFTGPAYGWMCPFHKSMSNWYDATLEQVLNE